MVHELWGPVTEDADQAMRKWTKVKVSGVGREQSCKGGHRWETLEGGAVEADRWAQGCCHAYTWHLWPDGFYLHKTLASFACCTELLFFLGSVGTKWPTVRSQGLYRHLGQPLRPDLLWSLLLLEPQTLKIATLQANVPNVTANLSSDVPLTFEKAEEQMGYVVPGWEAVLEFQAEDENFHFWFNGLKMI